MKIILNSNGNITIDAEEYNQEEIAIMVRDFLKRQGIYEIKMYQEKENTIK